MRRHGWFALVTLAALGCGAESGIFAEGETGSGAGSETSGSGGETTTSTGTGGDPTSTGTGGAPSTTGTGGDPTSTGTGGTGGDPTTTSTGVGGDGIPPVDCGNTTCKVADEGACCWDNYQAYGPPQGECVQGSVASDGCQTFSQDEPGQPGAETRIECQLSVHCSATETCCGELRSAFANGQQIFFYESVTCQQNCGGPQQQEIPLCDPTAATPCPMGGNCQQSSLLPTGYFVCAN